MRAVYAGSFDPPTRGHKWVIETARQIFPDLEVLVAQNGVKRSLFDYNARVAMLKTMHDKVYSFGGLQPVADYAYSTGAKAVIRGCRTGSEFDHEATLATVNAGIADIPTVLLVPPPELRHVSSTVVKEIIGLDNWGKLLGAYVTPEVLEIIKERL